MTLLLIAGALFILLVIRSVAVIVYAQNPHRKIETRLADFVSH
jgi:hypothetical protein